MGKILVADDEKEVLELLKLYLEKDGFEVLAAEDGMSAFGIAQTENLDCAVLDVMMPELNGFQLLKKIREKSNIPVIMLTARNASSDKVLALDMGADDYVSKPFDPLELCARIKANIRRYASSKKESHPALLKAGSLTLDVEKCLLFKNDIQIEITSTEFRVLQLFMANPDRVFTKIQISEAGWGENAYVEDNSIMVTLSKLRTKLGGEGWIKNIRGLGYRMEIQNEK
ncbi:MAG: response regulator transcription factor [Treponema sp.]|nr:response regulator transcription factor [Treponema sp.]